MVSPLKFFLDAEGGSLAFLKEKDYADYVVSDYRAAAGAEGYGGLPSAGDPGTLDVKEVRNALIAFVPDGILDQYGFTVCAWTETGEAVMQAWYLMDGGTYEDQVGPKIIGVDVFGVSYITVLVNTFGGTALHIEMAQIPYDLEP